MGGSAATGRVGLKIMGGKKKNKGWHVVPVVLSLFLVFAVLKSSDA